MVDLVVHESLVIQSHTGPYEAHFSSVLLKDTSILLAGTPHFIVDANVSRLYEKKMATILDCSNVILVEATEENKSIERIISVIERLITAGIRRDHVLVAIGGGIIQDITCFISSTLLRGIPWKFVPTTLLAQADSCIGSKSSVNLGATKNILGTFNPPRKIFICTEFLNTLQEKDINSGIGEILKVHAIDRSDSFDRAAADYDRMLAERPVLLAYIRAALLIKKRYIESDEFDRGIRNVFNYGHSFGHAIESATNFWVPHGIAVSMGMDMANHIAVMRAVLPESRYFAMRQVLRKNYARYCKVDIHIESFFDALLKDKKNSSTQLGLIFPTGLEAKVERVAVVPDDKFRSQCIAALEAFRHESD
jgi:3-dehydroquinate synthase